MQDFDLILRANTCNTSYAKPKLFLHLSKYKQVKALRLRRYAYFSDSVNIITTGTRHFSTCVTHGAALVTGYSVRISRLVDNIVDTKQKSYKSGIRSPKSFY